MKKIIALFMILAIFTCSFALAECAGGNLNCNGTSSQYVRHDELELHYDYVCTQHSNCHVYVYGYPWGVSCLKCGEWYRDGNWDDAWTDHIYTPNSILLQIN